MSQLFCAILYTQHKNTDIFVQTLGRLPVCDRHGSFDADREITVAVAVARRREGTNDRVHRDPTWPNGAARGLIRWYRASSQLHPHTHHKYSRASGPHRSP
uniref:Uncharacterized protein n=1 Tax=Triticum urartu TaxID=4572 RepID=A0A8R7TH90_TRIUA